VFGPLKKYDETAQVPDAFSCANGARDTIDATFEHIAVTF